MTAGRGATAARVVAVVLAALCLVAAVNTAYVVGYAVRESSAGAGVAAVVCVAVTAGLGWGAVRVWPS